MFIHVKEVEKYTKNKEKSYETLINTDHIEYIRYDDDNGLIQFYSGDYITVTSESFKKVQIAIYGEDYDLQKN